jgi:hypothetical protein
MTLSDNVWLELFPEPPQGDPRHGRVMREVRKYGKPLLLLPGGSRAAAAGMGLYPAQTGFARLAKKLMTFCFAGGFFAFARNVNLSFDDTDPFQRFLGKLVGSDDIPPIAALAGNPAAEGRRFMVLVYDDHERPKMVVKTGLSTSAHALIEHEQSLLRQVETLKAQGIPKNRAQHSDDRVRCFATDYVTGESPAADNLSPLPSLLTTWIHPTEHISLRQSPDWLRLLETATDHPAVVRAAKTISSLEVAATLQHGDFAPWNVKVTRNGNWVILDWERGCARGLPAWDWFHYLVQSSILVLRLPTASILSRIESLLASAEFRAYTLRVGLAGHERSWLQLYLLYVILVLRPNEGLAQNSELLEAFRIESSQT